MKKFIVEKDFWDLFPEAKIGVVVFYEIDNTIKEVKKYRELINNSEEQALNFLKNEDSPIMFY